MRIKRVLATVLAAAMLLGSTLSVSAEVTSPSGENIPDDAVEEEHSNSNVYRSDDGKSVLAIDSKKDADGNGVVIPKAVEYVGDGKNPVLVGDNNRITKVRMRGDVTVKKNAFKKTGVKNILIHSGATFEKDSLKGVKKVTLKIKNAEAAKNFKAKGKAGAKKVVVEVSKSDWKKLPASKKKAFKKQVKKLGGKLKLKRG